MSKELIKYTLQIADNALVIGHRLSEWCGHGPVLEQDIAITNMALDHLGQARNLYQYAASLFNELAPGEQMQLFASTALQNKVAEGKPIDEDDLAYLRDSWDFYNTMLVEMPNNDWAYTIARSFIYDTYNHLFYTKLLSSADESLAAIAEKSLKEVDYHMRWSSEWVIRLGDGTEESTRRMQAAINDLWAYSGELMIMNDTDKWALQHNIGTDLEQIRADWKLRTSAVLNEATLQIPADGWMHTGGKNGRHTEHLGYVLAELQFMQRAYPGMVW
ncbi:MAG: phenylacetate-CoA oxygenase subunit PaaC [Flavipsychrobacter sp.]|nr:phenylacetate-CoA oxygenase subunit PaaC [Flavipsychrobacter sp.]